MSNNILGKEYDFSYTGSVQSFVAPITARYKIECWGAEGGGSRRSGNSNSGIGGRGGYVSGSFWIAKGETLYVHVGGAGGFSNNGAASGGYNGGGSGYASSSSEPGNGGGGASDVRLLSGSWNSSSLYSRIIVAGGGGGGGEDGGDAYGDGGGTTGTGGYLPGTQNSASTGGGFGYGGSTNYGDGGGGGGGWYGGGTSSSASSGTDTQGGGGGSGYVLTEDSYKPSGYTPSSDYFASDVVLIAGNLNMPQPNGSSSVGKLDNGHVKITVSNFSSYYYAVIEEGKYYIPSKDYYDTNTKKFIEVEKDELFTVRVNIDKFPREITDIFSKLKIDGEEFYPFKKFKTFSIVKVFTNFVGDSQEEVQENLFTTKVDFRYKFYDELFTNTNVFINDEIYNVIELESKYINFNKENVKVSMFSNYNFYKLNLDIVKQEKVFKHGDTSNECEEIPITLDKFNIMISFDDLFENQNEYIDSIKIIKKIDPGYLALKDDEYDLIHDTKKGQHLIRFHKAYEKVYLSKTELSEFTRVNTLDNF